MEATNAAVLLCDDPSLIGTIEAMLRAQGLTVRVASRLQAVLSPAGGKPANEILFLYRRDPHGDLPGDCALLSRLDPQTAMPRILLSRWTAPALPVAMLRRHFMTALTVPVPDATLARACSSAAAAAARPGLPLLDAKAAPSPDDAVPAGRAAADPHAVVRPARRKLHILVADDNDINRRVVRKILERSGHQTVVVDDGLQAMDAMESNVFDLVLMDVNMPGMNGLEATRLYRVAMPAKPRLPILALTADATAETERNCIQAGMDGCITKPITPARLIARIDAMFQEDQPPARDHGVALIADHPRFPNAIPALDPAVLAELRVLGGSGFVDELLHGFINDAHGLIERIDSAIDASDMTGFRFELHAMCSAAANIGAASLRDAAASRDVGQATLATAGRIVANRLRHELACIEREWQKLHAQPDASVG